MSRKPQYLKELEEMIEAYGIEAVSEFLGISQRTIFNYRSVENPTTPHAKKEKEIHETFMKHQEGALKAKSPDQEDQGFKEKYYALLKEYNTNSSELKKMAEANQRILKLILAFQVEQVATLKQIDEDDLKQAVDIALNGGKRTASQDNIDLNDTLDIVRRSF